MKEFIFQTNSEKREETSTTECQFLSQIIQRYTIFRIPCYNECLLISDLSGKPRNSVGMARLAKPDKFDIKRHEIQYGF